ncbi:neural cell adhesion molecule 2 isoform X1 [Nomia melanderi]|uniref:neural cell adhesion molecule 2 isoform X1 n=1 Tax=Nomia melanderi TaxID=2448451 RepID=UPI0013044865|nr:synaptogenesis protein syg-2-like isoform X1 [Nomia melanderi]XP_031843591.1 synaptogenesis protein syg-2-like isoform X1 [Nomia melanderi]XP_031843592.1 synaptogenesis protein syg-2-like isoform X1 [Nomia melanderi]XP_031843593.1 synaptogenesis protein syg-2-like isoform X1 [Nomia melanderi]XP_031843594.1 synaptogenesis protein syg-2-like isoform X1 [Nomia melanderi]
MRCHVLAGIVALFTVVYAQGGPRTFSARPYRGGPAIAARAVIQGTAELPCDIRPPRENDSAILVVWYKSDITPIYSYDMRGKHSEKASHWNDKDHLNDRAFFRTVTDPATLNINHIEERDEGEYRCRVDFAKSPTRNARIHLTVIVPPDKPNIIDEHGKTVPTVAGPYEEGGDMKLQCLVTGGRPEPKVRWWRGELLLDSKDEQGEFPALRRNTLIVKQLSRGDLHAVFTCQAANNNISQPVSASVAIEMHLKPLSVTILSSEHAPLSADRKYDINCITVGSRPPAKLSWYMDGRKLTNHTEKVSEDGNMTSSTLVLKPTLHDHDKVITCRAENAKVQRGVIEDTWKLNVFFVPILHLELGSNMNPDDIEEGDDVYFECKVNANPGAYKVVWKHNGNVIQNNAKNGVIVQQYGLALREVNRSQAGNYTCIASNVEGDGYSNNVELKIMYKPICVPDQKRIYGVTRLEDARVICRVEAYPPPSSFRWTFNNTEEMVDVPQARYKNSTQHMQSVLIYRPVTEMDYGTVFCWASNTAGQQKNACVFHIIPAGKPESPYNCTLSNQTTRSLSVECFAGFDGGQPQHFLLEVYDQITGKLQANITSRESAAFTVQDLEPGKVLNMILYAVNAKGRSDPALLEGFTLKVAEKQTVRVLFTGTPVPFEITPLLGGLIGVVTALLLITVTILAAMKIRSDRRTQRPNDLPLKKGTAPSSEDLYDTDDRNPDVVPVNKGSDYQLTGSISGTPMAAQNTPDGLPPSSLSVQQVNHIQGLPPYSHEYNNYPTLPLSGEITYAELCLTRPTTLSTLATDTKLTSISGVGSLSTIQGYGSGFVVGGKPHAKEATIYACIDHNARPSKIDGSNASSCAPTPLSAKSTFQDLNVSAMSNKHHPSIEIVTVRTPLISTQESCV